jgi:anthranilate synthase component 2
MKILVIDNFDSFVFNLVHYLKELGCHTEVVRNDRIDMDGVTSFDKVLLSPGPGIPEEAGRLLEVIERHGATIPMLGVCLGHQAIAQAMGGELINLDKVYHGVSTKATINVNDEALFKGMPPEFEVGRYHSWVVDPRQLPGELEVTSTDKHGQIMSMRHRHYDLKGVQFHPESVLTPEGKQIIQNWVES